MENQTNDGFSKHLDYEALVKYDAVLAQAKVDGLTSEAVEDLKVATFHSLFIAQHPDEFE